jgi:hypothetical protein
VGYLGVTILDQGNRVLDFRTLSCVVGDDCHVAQKGCRHSMMSFGRVNYIRPESPSAHGGLLIITLIAVSRCLSSSGDPFSVISKSSSNTEFFILLILSRLYWSAVPSLWTLQLEKRHTLYQSRYGLRKFEQFTTTLDCGHTLYLNEMVLPLLFCSHRLALTFLMRSIHRSASHYKF